LTAHDFDRCSHFTCRAPGAAYNHLQAARSGVKEIPRHRCTETSWQRRRERFTTKGRRSASPTTTCCRSGYCFWCPLSVLSRFRQLGMLLISDGFRTAQLRHRVVRIYQPTRNTMQSGGAKGEKWRIDFDTLPGGGRWENPLIGWASSCVTSPRTLHIMLIRMF